MTFLRFLAWAFYWMRLELVALEQPHLRCSVTRERGRWLVVFGENVASAREAWCAIRLMLEGTPETEPLEFTPEALAKIADELEEKHERERESALDADLRARVDLERLTGMSPGELEAARERERLSAGIAQSELEHLSEMRGETLGDVDDQDPQPEPELEPRRGF